MWNSEYSALKIILLSAVILVSGYFVVANITKPKLLDTGQVITGSNLPEKSIPASPKNPGTVATHSTTGTDETPCVPSGPGVMVTLSPLTQPSTNYHFGNTQVPFATFTLQAGKCDVKVTNVTLALALDPSGQYVKNFTLKDSGGGVIGGAVNLSMPLTLAPAYTIAAGQTKTFTVYADVIAISALRATAVVSFTALHATYIGSGQTITDITGLPATANMMTLTI